MKEMMKDKMAAKKPMVEEKPMMKKKKKGIQNLADLKAVAKAKLKKPMGY